MPRVSVFSVGAGGKLLLVSFTLTLVGIVFVICYPALKLPEQNNFTVLSQSVQTTLLKQIRDLNDKV